VVTTREPSSSARRGAAIAIVLATAGAPLGAAASQAPWLQFRRSGSNNAVVAGSLRARWTFETGAPISASPAISGGVVYLGNNAGRVVALDARTGRLRWSAHFRAAVMAQPLVYGGSVVVGVGDASNRMRGEEVLHVGGNANALVALDAATGRRRWAFALAGSGMPTPAVVGGTLVQPNGNGDVVGLDPRTGARRYVRPVGSIASMSAALPIGPDVYVGAGQDQGGVFAIRASDGTLLWRHAMALGSSGIGDCPLAYDGQRLYGDYLARIVPEQFVQVGDRDEERVYALSARTGDPRWDAHLEDGIVPDRNEAAIPLVDGGRLFVGSTFAPYAHAFDTRTGALLWRRRVGGAVKGGLVARDGLVYFGDARGTLWALRERDGTVAGHVAAGTRFAVGSPVIAGRTLVIGSGTGRIVAVPLDAFRAAQTGHFP